MKTVSTVESRGKFNSQKAKNKHTHTVETGWGTFAELKDGISIAFKIGFSFFQITQKNPLLCCFPGQPEVDFKQLCLFSAMRCLQSWGQQPPPKVAFSSLKASQQLIFGSVISN